MNPVPTPPAKTTRSRLVTQERIDRRIKLGDGQGVREAYVPWIKVWSFASRGASHIVPGVKVHRAHHLLSTGEYDYHTILEHDQSIIDIREQFPLFTQAETQAIASSLNIRHPVYLGTQVPLVLTTDFLITQIDNEGKERLVARSLKYREEIESASKSQRDRTLEKLEIERRYWAARNVEWKLVFHENLSRNRIKNLQILRTYAIISPALATENNISRLLDFISAAKTDQIPLKPLLERAARAVFVEYMGVKHLFFHLAWTGRLEVDLTSKLIELSKPLHVMVRGSATMATTEVLRHA